LPASQQKNDNRPTTPTETETNATSFVSINSKNLCIISHLPLYQAISRVKVILRKDLSKQQDEPFLPSQEIFAPYFSSIAYDTSLEVISKNNSYS